MKIRFLDSKGNLIPTAWAKFLQIEYEFDEPFEVIPSVSPTEPVSEYEVITKSNDGKIMVRLNVPVYEKLMKTDKDLEITIPDGLVDKVKEILARVK